MSSEFTIVAWGPERPPMTFHATSARAAYVLALNKAVYASLDVEIRTGHGLQITLEDLERLALEEQAAADGTTNGSE